VWQPEAEHGCGGQASMNQNKNCRNSLEIHGVHFTQSTIFLNLNEFNQILLQID
jgi:hypothetical protein